MTKIQIERITTVKHVIFLLNLGANINISNRRLRKNSRDVNIKNYLSKI